MKRYSMSVCSCYDTGPQVEVEEDESGEYVRFDDPVFSSLTSWLLGREVDIALDMEDFGELKPIFRDIFGREPEKPT